MLSYTGWINGLLAMGNTIYALSFGAWLFYKAKKNNAKILAYVGIMILLAWLSYLGTCLDFITILLTGHNIDNTNGLIGSLNWMWPALGTVVQMYYAIELFIPDKKLLKWLLISLNSIIVFFALLYFFFDPFNTFTYYYPIIPGEDLIDFSIIVGSALFFFLLITIVLHIIFPAICGFIYKAIQTRGVLRKKFIFSSMAVLIFISCKLPEGLIYLGSASIFTKIGTLSAGLCWYFALREEPAEPKKKLPKKDVKVEESIFRLSKRPEQITEEEVTFHKEQKICLVCKGKVAKYNIFICPTCDVLYCQNCARTLENLENMCWVCGEPIDESKPVKPFEKEEEKIILEETKESSKKEKNSETPSKKQ